MTISEINDFLKAQDWDSAIAASTKLIDEKKNIYELFQAYLARGYARCFVSAKDEEYAKAAADLSMAIALLKDSGSNAQTQAECYAKRAYSYWLSSKYERAIADCEKVKELAGVQSNNIPADIKIFVYELLSQIYANTGYPIEAAEYSKEALKALQLQPAPATLCGFNLLEQYRLTCKNLKGD
jgi:tetratricopeptide (TPR) repeat protein